MFEVRSVSPIDDEWEQRDVTIIAAAGRKSDYSVASSTIREHIWFVPNFDDAKDMKSRIELVNNVSAAIRERCSTIKRGKK